VAGLFTIWLGLVSSFQDFDVVETDPTISPVYAIDIPRCLYSTPWSSGFASILYNCCRERSFGSGANIQRLLGGFVRTYKRPFDILSDCCSDVHCLAVCQIRGYAIFTNLVSSRYATSLGPVMVVAVLYGSVALSVFRQLYLTLISYRFSSGAFISLLPSVVSFMVPRQQLGRAIGFGSSVVSLCSNNTRQTLTAH
jgi:hypothetical protein